MALPTQIPLTLLCAVMMLTSTACDLASPEKKIAKHRERAQKYMETGQYPEAIIEYQNIVLLDPKNSETHYRLALALLKVGSIPSLQGAFAELSKTVELDKTNLDAQLKLGELYLLGSEPAKARERADIILASTPDNTESLILRGRSLLSETRYREGIAELKKAIELNPKNMSPYISLAQAYFAMKDVVAAESTLNQALAMNPRALDIMLALGDFRDSTGKSGQAEAIYRQAVETAPENEAVYLKLASHYQSHNRLADAENTLQKLATVKPQAESPQLYRGDFFTSIGQLDKALTSYRRAIEIQPGSTSARDKIIANYLDTGKIQEAEEKVADILKHDEQDLMGRFFNARVKLGHSKTDDAITLLQGVLKDTPQFAGAHYFLGIAFMQKQQPTQARAALTDAVKYHPKLGEAHTALAQIYLAEGSTDLALQEAHVALQIDPRNIQAAIISGEAHLSKGEFAKSRQVFDLISKALPKEPIGPYHLGLVARSEKNTANALVHFEEALTRRPSAIEPLTQIAMIKTTQGHHAEARQRVERQLEQHPQNPHMQNLLGQLASIAKDYTRAEQSYRKAIALNDALLPSYMGLAQTFLQTGKVDEAMKEYETVLTKDPNIIQAHMMLGLIHENRNELGKAQTQYETILKLNPKFVPAANNLAWVIVQQGGNLDVALSYAQTAREGSPDDPHIADTLGWVYYKKNTNLLAISLLKEAVEKLPNEPEVHFHYGMALAKNNQVADAKKSLQTALQLRPNFPGADEARKTLKSLS
ncbi:MAG: tetratricopeptide repeat protein [Nitrospira sp.]